MHKKKLDQAYPHNLNAICLTLVNEASLLKLSKQKISWLTQNNEKLKSVCISQKVDGIFENCGIQYKKWL